MEIKTAEQAAGIRLCVMALLYGNYPGLHQRLLHGFRNIPFNAGVRLLGNALHPDSEKLVHTFADSRPKETTVSYLWPENVPKYLRMRSAFEELKVEDKFDWLIWFDDDSYISDTSWYNLTVQYIMEKRGEQICYFGQPWYMYHLPGQESFIKKSKWFKNAPFEVVNNFAGINFAQGAYWGLSVKALRELDWPDPRLRHNGGDTLLAEAVRQQGWKFHRFCKGVIINNGKRRGISEAPAGTSFPGRMR
jgi:hypothetical protein